MNASIKIAIGSGKGGTGKTFVSTNLFNSLKKNGLNVSLVDCDAEEPNDREFIVGNLQHSFDVTQKIPVVNEEHCTYCSKCQEYCNYNAIFFLKESKMIRILDDLCHGCGACSVACSFNAITEKENVLGFVSRYTTSSSSSLIEARTKVGVHSPVKVIKAAIKEAAGNELILMDSPPGTSCPFIQTVFTSDYVVLVTEPTPFGLSDLKQSVETLKSLKKPYGVVVNREGLGNTEVYDYLQAENIPLLTSIPFDRNIATAYSKGKLVTDLYPEWEEKFNRLYQTIRHQHEANSRH